MADRFPLIIDNSAEKIKELVSGDNLDLTKSNLKNADHIQSAGVNVAGVATATSLIGDGSQLTNLPPSGGTLEATASGTLADGSKVIVNADGTVSVVAQTETTGPGVGSQGEFNSLDSDEIKWLQDHPEVISNMKSERHKQDILRKCPGKQDTVEEILFLLDLSDSMYQ